MISHTAVLQALDEICNLFERRESPGTERSWKVRTREGVVQRKVYKDREHNWRWKDTDEIARYARGSDEVPQRVPSVGMAARKKSPMEQSIGHWRKLIQKDGEDSINLDAPDGGLYVVHWGRRGAKTTVWHEDDDENVTWEAELGNIDKITLGEALTKAKIAAGVEKPPTPKPSKPKPTPPKPTPPKPTPKPKKEKKLAWMEGFEPPPAAQKYVSKAEIEKLAAEVEKEYWNTDAEIKRQLPDIYTPDDDPAAEMRKMLRSRVYGRYRELEEIEQRREAKARQEAEKKAQIAIDKQAQTKGAPKGAWKPIKQYDGDAPITTKQAEAQLARRLKSTQDRIGSPKQSIEQLERKMSQLDEHLTRRGGTTILGYKFSGRNYVGPFGNMDGDRAGTVRGAFQDFAARLDPRVAESAYGVHVKYSSRSRGGHYNTRANRVTVGGSTGKLPFPTDDPSQQPDRVSHIRVKDRSVTFHELGHLLQEKNGNLTTATRALFERRTRGEKGVSMKRLTGENIAGVRTKPDKWYNPYTGRVYTDRYGKRASEVVSTALEAFQSTRGMATLYQKDPELFALGLAALRGDFGYSP